jgi:Ran GTPase-activating protein (RanGAP) involved in mRNA processing and transport
LCANNIYPDAITALAASTTLSNLTHVNLSGTWLNDKEISQLLSPLSILAQKLQSVNLSKGHATGASLRVLSNASPHLTELVLDENDIGPAGAEFIATRMPNLTTLHLRYCGIEDEGYTLLAASTTLPNLRELHLDGNFAEEAQSIIALVNSPVVANLTHLDLSGTRGGIDVITAIAQSTALSKLRCLNVATNQLGDEAAIALAQSTTLMNLTWLDVSNNEIGPDGIKALLTSPVVSKLTYLNLKDIYELGTAVADALALSTSTLPHLAQLDVEETEVDVVPQESGHVLPQYPYVDNQYY